MFGGGGTVECHMANAVSKSALSEDLQPEGKSSDGKPLALIEQSDADLCSIVAEIGRAETDVSQSGQTLGMARDAIREERLLLLGLKANLPPTPPIVFERGETAIAQVVLAAQERSKRKDTER
jgi:hypothetical protein